MTAIDRREHVYIGVYVIVTHGTEPALNKKRQLRADLALFVLTLIWGSTFVMVKEAVASYPVFPFLALRFAMATVILLLIGMRRLRSLGWKQVGAGVLIGLFLFTGYAFQTIGLQYTTASKAGFITGLSVVLVPTLAVIFMRHRLKLMAGVGVLLATGGLAALTLDSQLQINRGDLIVLGCALAYALHILSISIFAPRTDPLALSIVQLATVTVAATAASFITKTGIPPANQQVWFAAAFTGVLATALAFAVQTAAQRYTSATHTALILVFEPVFAAIFGVLLAGDEFTNRILAGGLLIVSGMVVSEIDWDETTAQVISRFLAPTYVSVPVILLTAMLSARSWWEGLLWGLGILLVALPLPLYLVRRELKRGGIGDWFMRNRCDRLKPIPILAVLFAVLVPLGLLVALDGPRLLLITMAGAAALSLVNLLITTRWKISQHVSVISYALGIVVGMLGWGLAPLLILIPIVAWSRVKLDAHTRSQTIAGGIVGLTVAALFLLLF
ncbi:MAG: DMT family transporter [Chloroflexi bacterium]|nr:DMT family transporter [Chloroflexota bacterium]